MKNVEQISNLIDASEMSHMEKIGTKVRINTLFDKFEKENESKNLIREICGNDVSELILDTEEVKIYIIKHDRRDDFTIKYPYRFIYKRGDKWICSAQVHAGLDTAFLTYLGESNLGLNTEFTNFAMKMLGMPPL